MISESYINYRVLTLKSKYLYKYSDNNIGIILHRFGLLLFRCDTFPVTNVDYIISDEINAYCLLS